MMQFITIVTILHIIGATITGGICLASLTTLVLDKVKHVKTLAYSLSFITLFQIVSGSLLSVLSAQSLALYCTRIGLYLLIVGVVQLLLLSKFHFVFSKPLLYLPHAASFAVTLLTVTYLLT